jgi:antitoxin component YwqK of YwqJK toxin-antitoxin module
MKKFTLFLAFLLTLFISCDQSESPVDVETVDTSGYEIEDIPGLSIKRVVKKDAAGNIIEEGYLDNSLRVGTWLTYEPGNLLPDTLRSYFAGQFNGPYIVFNSRGQVELRASYKNNKLHGSWGQYRFGRPEKTASYKEGVLDGVFKEFYTRDGKLQKEIHYKDGQPHGPYRFYNEEGAVTLEYIYRDGERISGGIVDTTGGNEPR